MYFWRGTDKERKTDDILWPRHFSLGDASSSQFLYMTNVDFLIPAEYLLALSRAMCFLLRQRVTYARAAPLDEEAER